MVQKTMSRITDPSRDVCHALSCIGNLVVFEVAEKVRGTLSGVRPALFPDLFVQGYLTHKKTNPIGPYRRPMRRVLGGSHGGWCFLMGEIPMYTSILGDI